MKFAFIADVHIGPSGFYKGVRRKMTEFSELYIFNFVRQLGPDYDFAINLGDLIQDDEEQRDIANYKKGLELFGQAQIPIYHLVGNHDTVNIQQEQLENLLEQKQLYYSFDVSDIHFIVLYSKVYSGEKSIIDKKQKDWLIKDLEKTDKPTMVFSHHSLAEQILFGNPWFQGEPEACLIENRKEIRGILFESQKVIAVLNGHLHWNNISHHDGIPYISVQSATENFNNDDIAANAWGVVEIKDNMFKLMVFGNDPFEYEYEFYI